MEKRSRHGRANVCPQFLTSRVSTPTPFRPKHLRQFSEAEIEALERLNLTGNDSPISPLRNAHTPSNFNHESSAGSVVAQKIDIAALEQKAAEAEGKSNGHA